MVSPSITFEVPGEALSDSHVLRCVNELVGALAARQQAQLSPRAEATAAPIPGVSPSTGSLNQNQFFAESFFSYVRSRGSFGEVLEQFFRAVKAAGASGLSSQQADEEIFIPWLTAKEMMPTGSMGRWRASALGGVSKYCVQGISLTYPIRVKYIEGGGCTYFWGGLMSPPT